MTKPKEKRQATKDMTVPVEVIDEQCRALAAKAARELGYRVFLRSKDGLADAVYARYPGHDEPVLLFSVWFKYMTHGHGCDDFAGGGPLTFIEMGIWDGGINHLHFYHETQLRGIIELQRAEVFRLYWSDEYTKRFWKSKFSVDFDSPSVLELFAKYEAEGYHFDEIRKR
jgi:hypothetical protein